MEINMIPIGNIRPDPNQPRTIIDEDQIKGMAKSIVTEGIINPIEVDPGLMIVTGEMRWRAAKIAGLQEVPCKTIEITPDERFMRQVIENLHHNTMNALDTAKAMAKMLHLSPGDRLVSGRDYGMSKLADQVGKSQPWISDLIGLLNEPAEVQEYLESPDAHHSFIREINRHAPEEIKTDLKRKVTSGDIKDRETINEVIRAVKRTPEKKDEIFNLDLSGRMPENMHKIHQISPPVKEAEVGRPVDDVVHDQMNGISNLYQKALDLMEKVDLDHAPMQTTKMLLTNGIMFLQGFNAFQGKLVSIIEHAPKHELQEENE